MGKVRSKAMGRLLPCVAVLLACGCASGTHALRHEPLAHAELDLVTEAPPSQAASRTHRVAPGENLFRIAQLYQVRPSSLAQANGIEDPTKLSIGQELVIPKSEGPVASAKAVETPPAPQPQAKPVPVGKGDGRLEWPVRGVLYGRFGKKAGEPHDGIDLAAPKGTPVQTAAPGTVLFAGEQKGYGLIAIVEHDGDLITLYAHNRDLRVKSGQKVRKGQVIATVGESGKTSGPHLHFEVRVGGRPVDPLGLLGPVPKPQERSARRAPNEP